MLKSLNLRLQHHHILLQMNILPIFQGNYVIRSFLFHPCYVKVPEPETLTPAHIASNRIFYLFFEVIKSSYHPLFFLIIYDKLFKLLMTVHDIIEVIDDTYVLA